MYQINDVEWGLNYGEGGDLFVFVGVFGCMFLVFVVSFTCLFFLFFCFVYFFLLYFLVFYF